jgi:hypothetical protein
MVRAVGIGLKGPLRRRKLLIIRSVKIAKSRKIAEARYTPGTQVRLKQAYFKGAFRLDLAV